MDFISNGRVSAVRQSEQNSKEKRSSHNHKSNKAKKSHLHSVVTMRMEPSSQFQRVYLYIQLKSISHLPVAPYPLELHLYHAKNTLQSMKEQYTKETIIYQDEFNRQKPSFAMAINQDSIEDMNTFSDNPLVVALYQRIPRHRRDKLKTVADMPRDYSYTGRTASKLKAPSLPEAETEVVGENADEVESDAIDGEDEDYVEESLEFLSRGHCDLLQLFQRKRFISDVPIMLYAEYDHNLETTTSQKITTISHWHMYSILPMLKNFHFTNLIFLVLESIYNVPDELHQKASHLGVMFSMRSTAPVEEEQEDRLVIPLCSFYGFISQVIGEQNKIIVWENVKRDLLHNMDIRISSNQMETNMKIKLPRLFQNLLKTPDTDLKIDEINKMEDRALINNSLHRYVLSPEMCAILESAIVHNEFEVLLQLYQDTPTNVIYEGAINLSVFGYPDVNYCRFACALHPLARISMKDNPPRAPMFAISRFCFFHPLTKVSESLDAYNEDQLKMSRLTRCPEMEILKQTTDSRDSIEEIYRSFDNFIKDMLSFIVKNNVTDMEEQRQHFCCHLGNLSNLLINICASDFNIRIPTKTNIEFREMLTHMHKDLMARIEGIIKSCAWENPLDCLITHDADHLRVLRLFDEYRTMCVIGQCKLARKLWKMLNDSPVNKRLLNFYTFLNAVESLNFERATQYLRKQRERNWNGDYFVSILKIYIDYKLRLGAETNDAESYSSLLEDLRNFSYNHPQDIEVWVLLYCLYKRHNYLPGMEYTRWKYENLLDVPKKVLPQLPRPLYNYYLPAQFCLSGKLLNGARFYEIFETFTNLGAYGFAEIIFEEISTDFTPVEVYLIRTTLKLLQGGIDMMFKLQNTKMENTERGQYLKYCQAQVNGNIEYARRNFDKAVEYYRQLLSVDKMKSSEFYLSLMRLGHISFKTENFDLAREAYEMCLPEDKRKQNFMVNYGLGLTLYYHNKLEEAIEYFSRTTENDVFMPDSWGYLALVNLRLSRNKTALECWKIARMRPELPLNNLIYTELAKIPYSEINLLPEDDCKPPT